VKRRRLRVLYVISRRNTFTDIDRSILADRYEVTDYYQPEPRPRLRELAAQVRRSDLVFAWFAGWHSFPALVLARILGKPSVVVVGGFDTARVPEIGYGWQRGGVRRWVSRGTMRLATRIVTNSRSSLVEIERNVGLDPRRAAVIYHGLADRFPDGGEEQRDRLALSVGVVRKRNLERKGLRPFVGAAARLPDVEFVLAGSWRDDAIDGLRRDAATNVRFTGFLADADLDALFRRAAVYVQASRHEGFGLSLAEAMLAGCVPVVTDVGALPEVVGDVGVTIAEPSPSLIAEGVERALRLGPAEGARARDRVLEAFPLEPRAEGLRREVEAAAAGRRSG
jgi:glycosyltransferase involved in cell wall biosynthesis